MDNDNELCQYHYRDHAIVIDLKDAMKVIVDGQQGMRESLVQLTEAFKNMDRIETRIEKMEEERDRKEEKRDLEIQELRTFMNKVMAWGGAAIFVGGIALKFIGV